jgi:hypothetical protein
MAVLTVTDITIAGLNPASTLGAAANTDEVPTGNRTFLLVRNGSGASITVTAVSTLTVGGLAVADAAVAVPAGEDRWIGPFPANVFANASGNVDLDYSATASVTRAAFQV